MEILRIILPLLIVCVVVVYFIYSVKKRQGTDKDNGEETYMSEGMSIGICLGVAVSTALDGELAIGISVGMMLGMAIGMSIKKK